VDPSPAAPRALAPARASVGGSGYGSAKFEAANSERCRPECQHHSSFFARQINTLSRYQWLEDVRDAQGKRRGEPGAFRARFIVLPARA